MEEASASSLYTQALSPPGGAVTSQDLRLHLAAHPAHSGGVLLRPASSGLSEVQAVYAFLSLD